MCRLATASETELCASVDPLVLRLRQADPTARPEAKTLHDALTDARDQAVAAVAIAALRRRGTPAAVAEVAAPELLRRTG